MQLTMDAEVEPTMQAIHVPELVSCLGIIARSEISNSLAKISSVGRTTMGQLCVVERCSRHRVVLMRTVNLQRMLVQTSMAAMACTMFIFKM